MPMTGFCGGLAKPDNFAIWTDDEPQRWNLGDAGSLYNFISGAAVRDPALRGNDMSMLFLVVSQELYEQLQDHALETGLNLQELMLIILKWLLKHPGQNPAYHTHGYWGCLNTAYQNRRLFAQSAVRVLHSSSLLLSGCWEVERQLCGRGADDAQHIVHLIHTPWNLSGHAMAQTGFRHCECTR